MFILLASENFDALIKLNLHGVSEKNEYRIWLVICVAFVLPLTWFGTPKNFWPVALIAILATTVACVLITAKIGYGFDGTPPKRKITVKSFFAGNYHMSYVGTVQHGKELTEKHTGLS